MTTDLAPYPRMKESAVPWLGRIPLGWRVQRLKNISNVIMGQSPASSDCNTNRIGVPFLQGCAEFGQQHPDPTQYCHNPPKVSPPNAVLVSVRAPVGRLNRADRQYGIGRGLCAISPISPLCKPSFIQYYLEASSAGLAKLSTGSTYDAVSVGDVASLPIPVPSLAEQTAIARFLDHMDRRIQKYIRAKEKLIALLDEYRQALIHQAVAGHIDVRTGEPYPEYKESGVEWIGTMPSHWQRTRLKALIQPIDVRSAKGNETLLSLRRDHGIVVYAEHFSRPPQGASLVGYKLINPGHLVVNRLQANNGLMFCSALSGVVSPDYSVFERKTEVRVRFLSEVLRTRLFRTHFRRQATGLGTGTAGFLRLYDDDFLATPFCHPPFSEQTRILAYIDSVVRQTESAAERTTQSIAFLREYRTRLIADAITGKLDVREVAATLPEIDPLASDDQTDEPLDTGNTPTLDQENQPAGVAA